MILYLILSIKFPLTIFSQTFSELEKPILMAILFFLFQLPIFNTILKKYVKGIFSNDENLNIYGYIEECYVFINILFFNKVNGIY